MTKEVIEKVIQAYAEDNAYYFIFHLHQKIRLF